MILGDDRCRIPVAQRIGVRAQGIAIWKGKIITIDESCEEGSALKLLDVELTRLDAPCNASPPR